MSDDAPRARRLATPSWLDTRLVLGVVMVLVAVIAGARVLATADDAAQVWVARTALVPGEHLTTGDLTVGAVRFHGQGRAYIAAGPLPPGEVVTRYVAAGELVPRAALTPVGGRAPDSRLVTVPVDPAHLPADLGRGDLVDVYLTAKGADSARLADPVQVLAAAPVEAVDGGGPSLVAGDTRTVVLAVPADRTPDLVHAVESGMIDLVRLPPTAAVAAAPPAAIPSAPTRTARPR